MIHQKRLLQDNTTEQNVLGTLGLNPTPSTLPRSKVSLKHSFTARIFSSSEISMTCRWLGGREKRMARKNAPSHQLQGKVRLQVASVSSVSHQRLAFSLQWYKSFENPKPLSPARSSLVMVFQGVSAWYNVSLHLPLPPGGERLVLVEPSNDDDGRSIGNLCSRMTQDRSGITS